MDARVGQLPVTVRLAWWGTAWLRGVVVADHLIDAVLGEDAIHQFRFPDESTEALVSGLSRLRNIGADAIGVALPVEGDLLGLGGPAGFNAAALDAGEAALAVDAVGFPVGGLVPVRVGAAVTWEVMVAARRQLPDIGEADRALRAEMTQAADALARLDVARWRPEVADLFLNPRARRQPEPPPGTPPRCAELAGRALFALDIVALALVDDGGALTVFEAEKRRSALIPLERAARRGLVAAASPEVWPPEADSSETF